MSKVEFAEFQRLDLRTGKVLTAERIPGKSKIYKLQIDIGTEKIETIVGGAEYYTPEYFVGRMVIVLVNLPSKTIGGIESKGMLLAADLQGKPIWLTVDGDIPPGTKIR
jgi:methionine--tRNA ligase beta chain